MPFKSAFILSLALALGFADSANACISFPKQITLKGASFVSSGSIQVGSGTISEYGKKVISVTHGTTQAFYHPEKKQWCFVDTADKKEIGKRDLTCLNDGQKIELVDDKNGDKKNGVVETHGNKIIFFSVNDRGQKEVSRPYLSFTDRSQDMNLNMSVEAMNKSKQVGKFEMTDTTLVMRSISVAKGITENVFDLNGQSIEAGGGCSKTATVAPFGSSDGGSQSGAEAQGSGAK